MIFVGYLLGFSHGLSWTLMGFGVGEKEWKGFVDGDVASHYGTWSNIMIWMRWINRNQFGFCFRTFVEQSLTEIFMYLQSYGQMNGQISTLLYSFRPLSSRSPNSVKMSAVAKWHRPNPVQLKPTISRFFSYRSLFLKLEITWHARVP